MTAVGQEQTFEWYDLPAYGRRSLRQWQNRPLDELMKLWRKLRFDLGPHLWEERICIRASPPTDSKGRLLVYDTELRLEKPF